MITIRSKTTGEILVSVQADTLAGQDLSWYCLKNADLKNADLSWADLTHANLTGADLTHANLTGAYLTHANLTGAYLTHANLTGADLRGADLTGDDFTWADLTDAKFGKLVGADCCRCELVDVPDTHRVQEWPTKNDIEECCGVWDIGRDIIRIEPGTNVLLHWDSREMFDKVFKEYKRIEPMPEQCIIEATYVPTSTDLLKLKAMKNYPPGSTWNNKKQVKSGGWFDEFPEKTMSVEKCVKNYPRVTDED